MKKLSIAFIFILFYFYSEAQSPTWQWAQSSQGANSDNANAIITDQGGNIIVAGFFYSPTISFGTFTLSNTGNYDLFVVKYDAGGNVLWAKSAGGMYDEVGCGIATDAAGNIYVTGYFYSPVMSATNFSLSNSGAGDCFIIKYNSNGTEQWMRSIGGPGDENGLAIASDALGNISITGFFQSSQLALGSYSLTNAGSRDVFVARLNSMGIITTAFSFGDTGNESGQGITIDGSGNFFVTGYFYSPAIVLGTTTITSAGSSDAFIASFSPTGNSLWAKRSGGGFNDAAYAVNSDGSGNIYIVGGYLSTLYTAGSYTFANSGGYDLFLSKYSNSGTVLWAKTCGGGQDDIAYGISHDVSGNVFITGHFHSPAITIGSTTLSNTGVGDMYVFKCDPLGNFMMAQSAGGTMDDGGSAVACDPAGNTYVTGYFFSNSVAFSATTLFNTGSDDMFIAKLPALTSSIPIAFKESPKLYIYPNPATSCFYIPGHPKGIKMLNSAGQEVNFIISDNENETKITLPLTTPTGIYTILFLEDISAKRISIIR